MDDLLDGPQGRRRELPHPRHRIYRRMAEDLTEYMHEQGIRVRYMHSDIDTIERIKIYATSASAPSTCSSASTFARGARHPRMRTGGDTGCRPEGFLRSETSLIQTIGPGGAERARRRGHHVCRPGDGQHGARALAETNRRRDKQIAYNEAHGITPQTIKKNVEDILAGLYKGDIDMNRVTARVDRPMHGANLEAHLDGLRTAMRKAAENLEFEEAARIRDEVKRLEAVDLVLSDDPLARQSAVEEAIARR